MDLTNRHSDVAGRERPQHADRLRWPQCEVEAGSSSSRCRHRLEALKLRAADEPRGLPGPNSGLPPFTEEIRRRGVAVCSFARPEQSSNLTSAQPQPRGCSREVVELVLKR